ncbi:MAG: PHP domain-containing protein [Tenuifilaceae bacterium]|nr:PHP domain-containing protein [Tenuifilaceae bacterium]
MSDYVPLHIHTEFSIRDSTNKIKNYVAKCKEYGYQYASISDHGNMSGGFKFYNECKKNDIIPILGQEFYYFTEDENSNVNYHLILYAKNNKGWENLCKLSSDAYINNFYKKPRTCKSMLSKFSEGLICTPACCFGLSQQYLLNNEYDKAIEEIKALRSIFREDFYLEIANHELEEEVIIRDQFRNIGNDLNIKTVLGLDSHYTNKDEQELHSIFKNISYNSIGKDNDASFNGTNYHIYSPEDFDKLFDKDVINNSLELASKCNISFKFTGYNLPLYSTPEKKDSYEHLKDLCYKGLKDKGLDTKKEYTDRLEFELEQIHLSCLEDYVLIVADYINWAKNNDIPTGCGRGSSGASMVCYLTRITEIDPLVYDLPFARFLNSGRIMQYKFFED